MSEYVNVLRSMPFFQQLAAGQVERLEDCLKVGATATVISEALLEEAQDNEAKGAYAEAGRVLEIASKLSPHTSIETTLLVQSYTARIYLKRGQFWKAQRMASRVLAQKNAPPAAHARALLVQAGLAVATGQLEKAEAQCRALLETFREECPVERLEASMLVLGARLARGDLGGAQQVLQIAKGLVSDATVGPGARIALAFQEAILLVDQEHFPEAYAQLEWLEATLPASVAPFLTLVRGLRLYCQPRIDDIAEVANLLREKPEIPSLFRPQLAGVRAAIYERHGYPGLAAGECQQLVRQRYILPPLRAAACMTVARQAAIADDSRLAMRYANQAIAACPAHSPELAKYYGLRGAFRLANAQPRRGLRDARRALNCQVRPAADPAAILHVMASICCGMLGKQVEAEQELGAVIVDGEVHAILRARAQALRGQLRYHSGNQAGIDDALDASTRFLESQLAEAGLTARLAAEGLEEVLRDLSILADRAADPCQQARALLTKGAIFAVSERWDEAILDINRVITEYTSCQREYVKALELRMHYFGISRDTEGFHAALRQITAFDMHELAAPNWNIVFRFPG